MTPTAMRARAQIGRTGACEPSPAGTADGTVAAAGADTPAAEPATPAETEPGAGTFTGFLAGALAGAGAATVAADGGAGRTGRRGGRAAAARATELQVLAKPSRWLHQRGSGGEVLHRSRSHLRLPEAPRDRRHVGHRGARCARPADPWRQQVASGPAGSLDGRTQGPCGRPCRHLSPLVAVVAARRRGHPCPDLVALAADGAGLGAAGTASAGIVSGKPRGVVTAVAGRDPGDPGAPWGPTASTGVALRPCRTLVALGDRARPCGPDRSRVSRARTLSPSIVRVETEPGCGRTRPKRGPGDPSGQARHVAPCRGPGTIWGSSRRCGRLSPRLSPLSPCSPRVSLVTLEPELELTSSSAEAAGARPRPTRPATTNEI